MYPQMKKPVGMLIHLMYGNNYSSPLSYKVTPSVQKGLPYKRGTEGFTL
jgi:hypothetical protein